MRREGEVGWWQVLRAKGTVCAKTQRAGTHMCALVSAVRRNVIFLGGGGKQ